MGGGAVPRSMAEDGRSPLPPLHMIALRCPVLPVSWLRFLSVCRLYIFWARGEPVLGSVAGAVRRFVFPRSAIASRLLAAEVGAVCSLIGFPCAVRIEGRFKGDVGMFLWLRFSSCLQGMLLLWGEAVY